MVPPCPIYWLRNDLSMNLRAGEWKCGWASSCRQHTSLSSASHNSESNSRTKPVKTHSVLLSSKVFVNEPRANNTAIIKTTPYVRPSPYTVIMLQKPVEVLIPPIMYIVQIDIQIPSKLGLVSLKHSLRNFWSSSLWIRHQLLISSRFVKVAWSEHLLKNAWQRS